MLNNLTFKNYPCFLFVGYHLNLAVKRNIEYCMKDKTTEKTIYDHYRQPDLEETVKTAFDSAGSPIKNYTDTESLDEFHIRGREATRELATLAGIKKGMRVLDLGCGIGGPARMLAAEFGCTVTGIDLVKEYCDAASMITQQTGLSHMVEFLQQDMTHLLFDDQVFDSVWTLHTLMNIEDKDKLFDDVFRVLKPGGCFALYEICRGDNSPPYFPVPWAADASMSFLLSPDTLRHALIEYGFAEVQWQDVSQKSMGWFQKISAQKATSVSVSGDRNGEQKAAEKKPLPNISILMGKSAAEKSRNVFRNLSEDRIRTVFGVYRKPNQA